MRSYCVKLWDNAQTLGISGNLGVIGRYYVKAGSITAAIKSVMDYARKEKFSACRVVDVCEIEETVL
jgi:hypothetical protein